MTTDPTTVEIIRNTLFYASEEMGIALRNSSYSPNIRERMDHSAAIFDNEGRLLAQAEHIPVHLGSLPLGLRNTLDYCEKENIALEESSMIIVNNPYITGERRVVELVKKHGREAFQHACAESLRKTEQMMSLRLSRIPSGTYQAQDYLEDPDGHDIRVKVTLSLSNGRLKVDYTGTDSQVSNPLNSVYGVTLSGVYYVTRTLTGAAIPANHAPFTPITVHAPERTILNPTFPHPVAGGNVETSQRNADLLYRAFSKAIPDRVPADSGGSMNNVMMGGTYKGRNWAFYETIGVGLGARSDADGIDGIQANMTNTMNTPIEEIERSYPLLLKEYELRADSSGPGRHRGGTGI